MAKQARKKASSAADLELYEKKRRLNQSPEPKAKVRRSRGRLHFVVQQHAATRLHFDLRLEIDGVFKSWALPKGPTLDPSDQKLAVAVEDHPIKYGDFEGVIPSGHYGAGTVMIWDRGFMEARADPDRVKGEAILREGLANGHLTFVLEGEKLRGEFALIRLKDGRNWLLVKKRDAFSSVKRRPFHDRSVASGRTMSEIAAQATAKGEVWQSSPRRAAPRSSAPQLPAPRTVVASRTPRAATDKKGAAPAPKLSPGPLVLAVPIKALAPAPTKNELVEPYLDGLRALFFVKRGDVRITSKQGLSFKTRFPTLAKTVAAWDVELILDGWILARDRHGHFLRPRGRGEGAIVFVAIDLLGVRGQDLRHLPLAERLRHLGDLELPSGLLVHPGAKAKTSGNKAMQLLVRDLRAPYRGGVNSDWRLMPQTSKTGRAAAVNDEPRVLITHPDKVLVPDIQLTKRGLAEYYSAVAPFILPYLKDRPLSLHRHPKGIESPGFFHKDLVGYHPSFFATLAVPSSRGGRSILYGLCQNESSLSYLSNLSCIEINPWLSRAGSLDHADYCVIDLDPDMNPFDELITVARAVRHFLAAVKIEGFLKTSGATGLHIFVPLRAGTSYEESRALALTVCALVHDRHKAITSLDRNPAKRHGLIYLDAFQNARGQTIVAPYSVRPRPQAPVSTPLDWAELKRGFDPVRFNVSSVPRRILTHPDPWREMGRHSIAAAEKRAQLRETFGLE